MDSFSCSPQSIAHLMLKKHEKKLPENSEYAEMWHGGVILTLQWRLRPTFDQRATVRFFLSFPWFGMGMWDK